MPYMRHIFIVSVIKYQMNQMAKLNKYKQTSIEKKSRVVRYTMSLAHKDTCVCVCVCFLSYKVCLVLINELSGAVLDI